MFSELWTATGLSVTFDGKREDYFPDLMKWASDNGASVEGFEMVNFKEEGFGLRATRDIKVSLWGSLCAGAALRVEGTGPADRRPGSAPSLWARAQPAALAPAPLRAAQLPAGFPAWNWALSQRLGQVRLRLFLCLC